ncbi:MAG: restriction endonuclease [Actinobacteria bacterium]|nr:restriction endonuclease [Actinomycetota bacterium]
MELTSAFAHVVPEQVRRRYEFREVRNAAAVLAAADPAVWLELVAVLDTFVLRPDHLLEPGGNKSAVAAELDEHFRRRGWREARVDTATTLSLHRMPHREAGEQWPEITESTVSNQGYKVDNFKGRVALDVEWNAKDGNLDRDIGAYRFLYESGLIDVGVIVTRSTQDIVALAATLSVRQGQDREAAERTARRFATSTTTNIEKLQHRLARGDAGGCPVLAVAITAATLSDEQRPPEDEAPALISITELDSRTLPAG